MQPTKFLVRTLGGYSLLASMDTLRITEHFSGVPENTLFWKILSSGMPYNPAKPELSQKFFWKRVTRNAASS